MFKKPQKVDLPNEVLETIKQLRGQLQSNREELDAANVQLSEMTTDRNDGVNRIDALEKLNRILQLEIDERRRIEKQLSDSEILFRKFFDLGRVGMAITSVEKGWIKVNDNLCQILGYARDELMNMTWAELTHPDDLEADVKQFNRMLSGEIDGYWMEKRFIRKNGGIVYAFLSVSCMRNEDGSVDWVMAHLQDVSARKKSESALRESEQRFKRVAVDAPYPLRIHAEDGEILTLSRSWTDISGYGLEEVPTMADWMEKAYGKRKENIQEEIERLYQIDDAIHEGEFTVQCKNGESRIWDFRLSPLGVLPDGRRIVMSVAVDVTERNYFEDQLKTYSEDLKRSNNELEQFAYVASHDLQEPLRKIASFTELFVKRFPDLVDEKAKKYIDYILDGTKRMQKLIRDLLMYSRAGRQNVEIEEVDLSGLLEHVKMDLSNSIRKKKIDWNVSPLPTVSFNRSAIYQVIQNLIANAIKFNHSEKPNVTVSSERGEGEWIFCVEDNGIGIEIEYRDRIFVIFQRLHTREEYEGTGIGLSVCKKIIEQRGGRIWIESEPGVGSKFFFTIPDDNKSSS